MNGSEGKVYKVKAFDKKVGEAFGEGEFVKNNLQKSKDPGSCTGGRGGGRAEGMSKPQIGWHTTDRDDWRPELWKSHLINWRLTPSLSERVKNWLTDWPFYLSRALGMLSDCESKLCLFSPLPEGRSILKISDKHMNSSSALTPTEPKWSSPGQTSLNWNNERTRFNRKQWWTKRFDYILP